MRFETEIGSTLVSAFAHLTGDRSSIHVDPDFARKTRFRGPIVHGMLPVLLLLSNLPVHKTARLASLSCRFLSAVRVGERLRFSADGSTAADAERWTFAIERSVDGGRVTTGSVALAPDAGDTQSTGGFGSLAAETLEENRLGLADLTVGQEERITINPDPRAAAALIDAFARQVGPIARGIADDPTVMAVVMASTLIGMRLPGRYATFLDLDATFDRPIDPRRPVVLSGTVSEIARTGSRMRLRLDWAQESHVVGHGEASTMIGSNEAVSLRCSEIRPAHMDPGFTGRTALVTGASRGIGEATAKLLAMHGVRVAVHYFRGRRDAEAIVADIRENGGEAVALQADLGEATAAAALVAGVTEALGPVDILVNNAVGEFTPKRFDDIKPADYLAELEISLFSLHAFCRAVLPHMRDQRWGKIINLGTVVTAMPVASQARYIAVKSAVVGHTRSLAVETAEDNIQVNVVMPAMTETSLIAGLPRALIDRLAADVPGGSLLQPIDVAKTILFLASDWSNAISGQQIALTRGAPPFL